MNLIDYPFRIIPTNEQLEGIEHLVTKQNAALFDRPGFGKTKQVIDAACILFKKKLIDTVIIVCPKSVCSTWDEDDIEYGEIAKHCWVEYVTQRYTKENQQLMFFNDRLNWVILSYGRIRKKTSKFYPISLDLISQCQGQKVWLVFDESSFIKSPDSNQFKASLRLTKVARKVTILNGTPVSQGVVDLWSQFMVLDPKIIENDWDGKPLTFPQFRSRYCNVILQQIGSRAFYKIVGDNAEAVDELRKKAKPWIMRRVLTGLPDKVYSTIEATLSQEEWRMYCDMRDTMVAWLRDNPSEAVNGAVKMMRLLQITSGHIGGLSSITGEENVSEVSEIGSSKQTAFLEWFSTIPNTEQIIVWCQFRKELERLQRIMDEMSIPFGIIWGNQSIDERNTSIGNFQRGIDRVLGCQTQAGGFGLNLQNAHISVYMSNGYSYIVRDQSEERIHRRGQKSEQYIIDIIAKGPNGQKTIDHEVIKALRHKEDVANWSCEHWLKILEK